MKEEIAGPDTDNCNFRHPEQLHAGVFVHFLQSVGVASDDDILTLSTSLC